MAAFRERKNRRTVPVACEPCDTHTRPDLRATSAAPEQKVQMGRSVDVPDDQTAGRACITFISANTSF